MEFGLWIRGLRENRGLTLVEVGAELGIDHARMSRIERSHARPSVAQVQGLVGLFGLDPEEALRRAAAVTPSTDTEVASS